MAASRKRDAEASTSRSAARGASKPHGGQPDRDRPGRTASRRSTGRGAAAPTSRRGSGPEELEPSARGAWSSLFRGPGAVIGQISGMDAPARALERMARSAERGASLLERFEDEVGMERALAMLERMERLADAIEDMHRSLVEIERVLVDLHLRVSSPLGRLALTRRRRQAGGEETANPAPKAAARSRNRGG